MVDVDANASATVNRDESSEILRVVGLGFGIPATLAAGLLLSGWLGHHLGVWDYYIAAVVMPVVGLSYAWAVAPRWKAAMCFVYAAIGISLAYWETYPAYFPEWHPRAYEATYVPFVLTCVTTATSLVVLLILGRRRSTRP